LSIYFFWKLFTLTSFERQIGLSSLVFVKAELLFGQLYSYGWIFIDHDSNVYELKQDSMV